MALYSKSQDNIFVRFDANFTKANLACGASIAQPQPEIQTTKKKKDVMKKTFAGMFIYDFSCHYTQRCTLKTVCYSQMPALKSGWTFNCQAVST